MLFGRPIRQISQLFRLPPVRPGEMANACPFEPPRYRVQFGTPSRQPVDIPQCTRATFAVVNQNLIEAVRTRRRTMPRLGANQVTVSQALQVTATETPAGLLDAGSSENARIHFVLRLAPARGGSRACGRAGGRKYVMFIRFRSTITSWESTGLQRLPTEHLSKLNATRFHRRRHSPPSAAAHTQLYDVACAKIFVLPRRPNLSVLIVRLGLELIRQPCQATPGCPTAMITWSAAKRSALLLDR